jgi:hypothetical protein
MASVSPGMPRKKKETSAFERSFDQETRRKLLEEDRLAWRIVCGELISIVAAGLILGICGVLLAT